MGNSTTAEVLAFVSHRQQTQRPAHKNNVQCSVSTE